MSMTHSSLPGSAASAASHPLHYGPPTANEHLRLSMHGSINWRPQFYNDYDECGPSIISRFDLRSLVFIGIAGTAIGSACLFLAWRLG